MKRLVLTDALIREALSPDARTIAPADLVARITAEVARTPQRRTLRLPALPQSRGLAWVLVGAAALLVLLGALLVAGGSPDPFEAVLPPAPSPLPQQQPVEPPDRMVAVSADEAWVAQGRGDASPLMWHRTSAGWAGPMEVEGAGSVTGLARLPDGRIVVGARGGLWVGNEDGWSRISEDPALDVAVDGKGTIWATVTSPDGWTAQGLRWYRDDGGAWSTGDASCPAGGSTVATTADGSTWTAGYRDDRGTHGLARLGSTCAEVFPLADGDISYDVPLIASDGRDAVAAAVMEPRGTARTWPAGRIMTWDGTGWTEVRGGSSVAKIARDGLAYAPDGTLWASIDGRLWRYRDAVWSVERRILPDTPLAVAPDGAVWFVAQDAAAGTAFVDRLTTRGDASEQAPAPTASPQAELNANGFGAGVRLLGIDDQQAWAARFENSPGPGLWGRTAAGWTGPISLVELSVYPRMTATIRGMADLGDGRLAIAADSGVWVGSEGSWTRAWDGAASDVAMAPDGRLWVSGLAGEDTLRVLRETSEGWTQDWSGCRAGGDSVAIAADGSTWTAGITFSSRGGVARAKDETCEQQFPLGRGMGDEVASIAASPAGAVAVHVLDPLVNDQSTGGRVLEWRDGRWTELRAGRDVVVFWRSLAYTPDGALWAVFGGTALNRYADGTWREVATTMVQAPISAAPDGTVWYVRADGVIDRLTLAP